MYCSAYSNFSLVYNRLFQSVSLSCIVSGYSNFSLVFNRFFQLVSLVYCSAYSNFSLVYNRLFQLVFLSWNVSSKVSLSETHERLVFVLITSLYFFSPVDECLQSSSLAFASGFSKKSYWCTSVLALSDISFFLSDVFFLLSDSSFPIAVSWHL